METESTLSFLIIGTLLGLSAGISPGPLLSLVISETLKHNKAAGIKIALGPLVSDLPIIAASLFVLSKIAGSNVVLGVISLAGGIFVAWLGYESLFNKELATDIENNNPESLRKGIIVNFLNPHPYLFWMTVGAPVVLKAWQFSGVAVLVYFLSFYICLVGSKIIVALVAYRSKEFITNWAYVWIMRILGASLVIFALFFFFEAYKLLTR